MSNSSTLTRSFHNRSVRPILTTETLLVPKSTPSQSVAVIVYNPDTQVNMSGDVEVLFKCVDTSQHTLVLPKRRLSHGETTEQGALHALQMLCGVYSEESNLELFNVYENYSQHRKFCNDDIFNSKLTVFCTSACGQFGMFSFTLRGTILFLPIHSIRSELKMGKGSHIAPDDAPILRDFCAMFSN